MINETDLFEERSWFSDHRASIVVRNLLRNNINADYVSDRKEALSKILEMIPQEASIGIGNSVTLRQVGIISELQRRKSNKIFDWFSIDKEGYYVVWGEEQIEVMRRSMLADVFLTGMNAITLDGKLISIDGIGNRVAPMIFGPKKVIVAVGVNKIVRNVEEGLNRVKEIAAPLVARWHYLKHHPKRWEGASNLPCIRTGKCSNCNHPNKSCRNTVIIDGVRELDKGRISVILIGEELGF